MIPVTKTFLPPQEEYQAILSRAWDAGWITNRGILVKELEKKLKDYLQVPNIIATTNGTLPLQIAIKALELKGEIITTPFSYVATTSSIVWENCTPVFVDIHPEYLTIDEDLIEAAITPQTSAILATHIFGNPCEVEAIDKIAKKYKSPKRVSKNLDWKEEEEWRYAFKKNLNRSEEFDGYEKWKEVAFLFLGLKEKFPHSFYLVEYEKLVENTQNEVEKLFSFCEFSMSKQTLNFLQKSTKTKNPDPYSVYRSGKSNFDDEWKRKLPEAVIKEIENDPEFLTLNKLFKWV